MNELGPGKDQYLHLCSTHPILLHKNPSTNSLFCLIHFLFCKELSILIAAPSIFSLNLLQSGFPPLIYQNCFGQGRSPLLNTMVAMTQLLSTATVHSFLELFLWLSSRILTGCFFLSPLLVPSHLSHLLMLESSKTQSLDCFFSLYTGFLT